MSIQSPGPGQRRLGRHLPSACPVADTGRIARRPVADPTECQDAAPREGHGVQQTRGLPRMVRKDSRSPADSGGKPPRQAHPSGSRDRVFQRQARLGTVGRARPPRREAWRQGLRPGPRRQASRSPASRPHPSEVASGRGELDGIGRARRPAGCLRFGAMLEPAVAKALRTHTDVRRTDRHLVLRSMAALCRWWGWIEPLHLLAGGGSAHACHLARFARGRRDL